jgi:hypothetical protein
MRRPVSRGMRYAPNVRRARCTHNPYLLNVFADLGWVGFIALFLGWLAAMGGAATGAKRKRAEVARHQVRQVA